MTTSLPHAPAKLEIGAALPPVRAIGLPWLVLFCLLSGLVLLPFLALIWIAFGANFDVWPHLVRYVLPQTVA